MPGKNKSRWVAFVLTTFVVGLVLLSVELSESPDPFVETDKSGTLPAQPSGMVVSVPAEQDASREPEMREVGQSWFGRRVADGIVNGRVIDVDGHGIAGLTIVANAGTRSWSAVSDNVGDFAIDNVGASRLTMCVVDSGWSTLFAVQSAAADTALVVAAQCRTVAGYVRVARSLDPVPDAEVGLSPGLGWVRHLGMVDQWPGVQRETVRSDANGYYCFSAAPDVAGCVVMTEKPGFVMTRTPGIAGGDQQIDLLLEERKVPCGSISGVVLAPDGRLLAGAAVGIAGNVVTTAEDGTFHAEVNVPVGARTVTVNVVATGIGVHSVEAKLPADHVVVRLVASAVVISGRVVDEHGVGLDNIVIEPIGKSAVGRRGIEGVSVGGAQFFETVFVEDVLNGTTGVSRSSADGAFKLVALDERGVRARFVDPGTLAEVVELLLPGTTHKVVLSRGPSRAIRGRVVDLDGRAVVGVTVRLGVKVADGVLPGATVVADDNGAFTMEVSTCVPEVRLELQGSGILPASTLLGDAPEPRIVVTRRRAVQLLWSELPQESVVTLHDAAGARVSIWQVLANGALASSPALNVIGDSSPVLAVPQNAASWRWDNGVGRQGELPFRLSNEIGIVVLLLH